ncbi:MAG: glutaminyl-peptide cyclotransferase, partial [Aequorivita sp.]|nr:glutaminyl-peptide cyclotransferase [Aequorivita sp.]
IRKQGLQAGYFGEGITILNNTLYQLTYKNGKCYTYDIANDFQLKNEFNYVGEGWGLCNDGKSLIMSNGSERIVYRNPQTFAIERTLEVYDNRGPIVNLNELEYIDGKIYANVYQQGSIAIIDPTNGAVEGVIDLTDLKDKVTQHPGLDVLNGIAYNGEPNILYITGKNWDKLFKIEIIQK